MPMLETITMTMRELDRSKVIQPVVEDGLMVWRAAEKLGISKRQVERLVRPHSRARPSASGPRAPRPSRSRQGKAARRRI